ncbi:MAG: VOC family protein [Caulobacterales bacterium]|nr:VOC family protein [Caulobacterales bacterium]
MTRINGGPSQLAEHVQMNGPRAIRANVVWHDLRTTDVQRARAFYADLTGWSYNAEYAADFVWTGGKAEYPPIMASGQAHGGMVEIAPSERSHWLAYVAVEDVDAAAESAGSLGGAIERTPFDIPGVGRAAVITDPQGAAVSPFSPSHSYPAPTGLFVRDDLFSADADGTISFYRDLFGWRVSSDGLERPLMVRTGDGEQLIGIVRPPPIPGERAGWAPLIATPDVSAAVATSLSLGATLAAAPARADDAGSYAFLIDPTGAMFGLCAR